jgi:hypothetical protein
VIAVDLKLAGLKSGLYEMSLTVAPAQGGAPATSVRRIRIAQGS